jgi:hypothetical protein
LEWSQLILYDQYWANTAKTEISRGANKISLSTSEAIGEMDITFGDRISSNSNCNQYNVKIQTTEDPKGLIQSSINRLHTEQKGFSVSSTE